MKPTMMTYINEEEEMCRVILADFQTNAEKLESLVKNGAKEWLILATGSSLNAAQSAKYYIENLADVRITIEEPFNHLYYEKLSSHLDLVIGISQSGQSTSTISALERVKKEASVPVVALTSDVTSEIAEFADITLDIGSGKERVGYVTKGFTATVLTLMLTGLHFAYKTAQIDETRFNDEINAFSRATDAIPETIAKTEAFYEKWQEEFAAAPKFTAIGYGPTVGTCKEFETKFSETVRVPSQGLDLEAFMHGPYLEVNPQHRIFFLETKSEVTERLVLLRDYESKYTPFTYTVKFGTTENERTLGIPADLDEFQAPFLMILPFQILAHHIAELKGNKLTERIYTDFGVAMKSKTKPGDYA
ncbi:SIS domain-containing protein [Listeria monocytogenes]|uniref:glutamine--fructose-6-phosphate aminotransferase n=1 Tax=Listeria monocytogenes TaxID=1639 RepID=UPI00086C3C2E|nr:SIS domain-containing protein [Listeria monocytogenes]EAE5857328.1 SIS domain-containing protein [Listeria monocytogenes]EAG6757606.1 SIS domain-containing protein [Listeria monocytogenes]EAG6981092.1 SIS domain-containing protein [Listeria monocytogenes]EAG9447955.1 SIS domain-containing protein [Listeria monocytogenes]EDB3198879.1 SIS domain-containing protein [Listeria monocytogenes]